MATPARGIQRRGNSGSSKGVGGDGARNDRSGYTPSNPDYRATPLKTGRIGDKPVFYVDAEAIARLLADYRIMGVK